MQQQWWPSVVANWQLWVPAQVINFALVPVHFQVLFANGVACIWNIYLSHVSHGAHVSHTKHEWQDPAVDGS